MTERLIKRVFVILALLIVLFQSFSLPIYASVHPWKGTPWSGNSWSGTPWSGNPWEGNSWKGNSWEGNDWEGNGTKGNGTDGQGTNGQSWNGNAWSYDPWVKNGWTPNGFQRNGTTGSPFTGKGTNGLPFQGNGTNGTPFQGNGTTGNETQIKPAPPIPAKDDPIYSSYDWFKFGVNDVGMSTIQLIAQEGIKLSDLGTWNIKSKAFYANLLQNSFKFSGKDTDWLEAAGDGLDVGKNFKDFKSNISNIQMVSNYAKTGISGFISNPQEMLNVVRSAKFSEVVSSGLQFGKNTVSSFKAMAPLGKLNVVGAAVGAGFSAWDTGKSIAAFSSADNKVKAGADIAQNAGSFLMNVGTGVAAFPGGQVVGGALLGLGAAAWLGGAAVKHWGTIVNTVKHPIKSAKKFGKSVANKAKKTWSTVKGWFS